MTEPVRGDKRGKGRVGMSVILVGLAAVALGAWLLTRGREKQAKVNLIRRVPILTTGDLGTLLPGEPIALSGRIRCEAPLTAQISKRPCVYFDYKVERRYEVREKNSKGDWETHRRSETVASHKQWVPFTVEDAAGRVLVRPERAEFDAPKLVDRFEPANQSSEGPSATLTLGRLQLSLNAPPSGSRTLGYHYHESLLAVGSPVYVLGVYHDSGEVTAPPPSSRFGRLIISHRTADELRHAWGSRARWYAAGAIASLGLGAILIVAGIISLFV